MRKARMHANRLLSREKRLSKSGYRFIAGVDEAGRGPLAGPVVAGAVILNDFRFKERIDDSKKLSAKMRERAYREILLKAVVGIGVVDEKVIDKINIYQATIKAMSAALANLEVPPDYVIVDGNVRIPAKCPVKCVIRGDSSSLSIACASIVAKVTRDRIMVKYDKIFPQYGFARHKGYPTRMHKEALLACGASSIHRRSFRPVRELCSLTLKSGAL
ncbi:MAG: ribonuclease HII [Candidatus Omnitrophica bacterium]|nr:ribonuclease HII [Candidatus Omnitrophota bacterium]